MFCSNCGKTIDASNAFCPGCGAKNPMAGAAAPTPSPAMPTYAAAAATKSTIKVKASSKGLFIGVIVVALVAFLVYLFFFTNVFKSDEDLIRARIENFASDYNDGDFEAVMKNFDSKTRSKFESAIGMSQSLLGGFTGYNMNYGDLFGLGVAANGGDMLRFDNFKSIDVQGDKATVIVEITGTTNIMGNKNSQTDLVEVELVKEEEGFLNRNWYIVDIRDA